jgi:transcriptional regulator
MYIPKDFIQDDINSAIEFIQQFPFGILVSVYKQKAFATHIPFVIEHVENKLFLYAHLSFANEQKNTFNTTDEVLLIFSEPHTYISPSLYEHQKNVPTWNYIAVHLYGKIKLANTNKEKLSILKKQIQTYEAKYSTQFEKLDSKYIDDLLNGILAFSIEVSSFQCQEKLSQNKSEKDRHNIKQNLLDTQDKNAHFLAKKMK